MGRFKKGFTLVELLIVISILGILVTIGLVSFRTAQARGRDTARKSDLKQIAAALELYNADYNKYPDAANGIILSCPSPNTPCTWGALDRSFTDNKTVYMKVVPKDPSKGFSYFYRTVAVDGISNLGFQLFASLENTQDTLISTPYTCGTKPCNYAVTSANTTPRD
jgi:general secretion pathway protein G